MPYQNKVISLIDPLIKKLSDIYPSFKVMSAGLKISGVGIWPVIHHIVLSEKSELAESFLSLGYEEQGSLQVAAIYESAEKRFSSENKPDIVLTSDDISGMAIAVTSVQDTVFYLEKQGIAFKNSIPGTLGEQKYIQVISSEFPSVILTFIEV